MLNKMRVVSSVALGVAASLLFSLLSVPAYASEAEPERDWVVVARENADACEALSDSFTQDLIPVPTSCTFDPGIFPEIDLMGSDGIFTSYGVSPMTWRGTNTVVQSPSSLVDQAWGGLLPVCHASGLIRKAGMPWGVDQYIPTDGLSVSHTLKPEWSECYLNESPAAVLWTLLQLPLTGAIHSSYFPPKSGISPTPYAAALTEAGVLFYYKDPNGTVALAVDHRLETIIRLWGEDFESLFALEGGTWCDFGQLSGTRSQLQELVYACEAANARAIYGDPSITVDDLAEFALGQFTLYSSSDATNGVVSSIRRDLTGNFMKTVADMETVIPNIQGRGCVTGSGSNVRLSDGLCVGVTQGSQYEYLDLRMSIDGFDTPGGGGPWTSLLHAENRLLVASLNPEEMPDWESRLAWTLVKPSDESASGPIEESPRELGIDPGEIEESGGCTTWDCPGQQWLENFPPFETPDCTDLDVIACIGAYIGAIFEWIGNFFIWLVQFLIPPDLDFFAWLSAVWGGFERSDAYFYAYGTHATVQSALASIESCTSIDVPISGSDLNVDFCGFENTTMSNVMRIVIILLGGWVLIATLYRFFAPRATIAAAVAPKTVSASVEDRT